MKKPIKLFPVLVCLAVIMTGCGRDLIVEKETKTKPSTGDKWTVMIYMCASSLEEEYGRAGEVLNSLSYDLPENINVIVETGGAENWTVDGIDAKKLRDFKVQKNGIRKIEEKPYANMGKASSYAAFLNRSIKNYPADKYISVIWGEGSDPLSGAISDAVCENDTLTTAEIAEALAATETKLDIIGFDTGMMSNLETAAALVPYADYMVASEDVMTYAGWDYRGLFEFLSQNPQASVVEAGQAICDGVSNVAWKEDMPRISMSVIDLADITKLMQDFDTLAHEMAEAVSNTDGFRRISAELENTERFGANAVWEGNSNLIDLKSFAEAVNRAVKLDCSNIKRSVSKSVVYKTVGTLHKNSCGISIYYPDKSRLEEYGKIITSGGYAEFLEKTTNSELLGEYGTLSQSFQINAEPDYNGKYIMYTQTPQIIKKAGVNIYKYDEEKGKYLYLATDYDVAYNNGTGAYSYELTNKQLELNGIPVTSQLVSVSGNVRIYSIPVIYEEEISSVRVSVTESDGEKAYKVLGIYSCSENKSGKTARRYKNPGVGDNITPLYKSYGETDEKYIKGKSMTLVFGGLTVKEKTLRDGEYLISYNVEDIYGKITQSNTTNVKAVKGKIQIVK